MTLMVILPINWDAGTYEYDANHPHAVRNVSPSKSMGLTNTNLSVKYNSVRLPIEIKESDKKYTIIYNGENSRIKSQYVENNSTVFTKYYSGPYEEIQKGSITQKNYYIYAGGRLRRSIRKARLMRGCIISIMTI